MKTQTRKNLLRAAMCAGIFIAAQVFAQVVISETNVQALDQEGADTLDVYKAEVEDYDARIDAEIEARSIQIDRLQKEIKLLRQRKLVAAGALTGIKESRKRLLDQPTTLTATTLRTDDNETTLTINESSSSE